MGNKKDLLSPQNSPNTLARSGVRRVNNLPLIIAIGVLVVFAMLIAMVAQKRANAQNKTAEIINPKVSSNVNTMSLANDVVGKHQAGIVPAKTKVVETVQTVALPVAVVEDPNLPPKPYVMEQTPDAELERIRQEKTQQFEDAVKAKTAVVINREAIALSTNNHNANQAFSDKQDASALFMDKLEALKGHSSNHSGNARMPQHLGGTEDEKRWDLNSRVQAPKSPCEVRAGWVIPGVMITAISSDLPNQIIAQVRENVYDTATGRCLVIPQGTKVLGLYSSEISYGQDTLLVAWQRLTFPDGKTLDLGSMPGVDGQGRSGFRDQVNHHFAKIFGSALLMSGIVGGITYSQNQSQPINSAYAAPTAGSVLSQALGQQLGEVTSQMIAKNLSIAPSLGIRTGYRFNIIVVKDLEFSKPYMAFDYDAWE